MEKDSTFLTTGKSMLESLAAMIFMEKGFYMTRMAIFFTMAFGGGERDGIMDIFYDSCSYISIQIYSNKLTKEHQEWEINTKAVIWYFLYQV